MKFLISREHLFFIKIWDVFYSPQFCSFLTMIIFRDYTIVAFGWVTQQWDSPWSKYFPIGNAQMNVKPKFNSLENWKVCITMKKKKKKKDYIGIFHLPVLMTWKKFWTCYNCSNPMEFSQKTVLKQFRKSQDEKGAKKFCFD